MPRPPFLLVALAVVATACGASAEAGPGSAPSTSAPPTTVAAPSATTTPPLTTTTEAATTTSSTVPPKGRLVIHGVGDVNVDPDYISALAAEGYDHAWSGLDGLFLTDDLTVVNLECPAALGGAPLDKAFTFRCDPEALDEMAAAGVDVAGQANNHVLDYGPDAMLESLGHLTDHGIGAPGAGASAAEAYAPHLVEVNGWTIAVLGFGGPRGPGPWIATDDRPGMADGRDPAAMVAAVEAAEAVADLVVVTIHWGVELDTEPRPDQVARARAMVGAGADVIFGHHSHRLQPMSVLDGAAVFWGLGNFVWPRLSVPGATTAVAEVVIGPDGTLEQACLIPATIVSPGHPQLDGPYTGCYGIESAMIDVDA